MRKFFLHIIVALICAACSQMPENAVHVDDLPDIFPDYKDVTIPKEIAPLNFYVNDSSDCVYVEAVGESGDKISASGSYADFDVDDWHQLTSKNIGKSITVKVFTKTADRWKEYSPFKINVSNYNLDEYGVTYRKIAPGYQTFSLIGVYQRNLSNFDEIPLLESRGLGGQCLNCHTPNRTNPDQYYVHIRGKHGATIIHTGGKDLIFNAKAEGQNASLTYGSWHFGGKYCAFSQTKVLQCFYTGNHQLIEPYDDVSDIVVLDVEGNQLITSPLLQNDSIATTPFFSADGNKIYYCSTYNYPVPAEYDKRKYSLCSIDFDAETGRLGDKVDTIINAQKWNKSICLPRPSYDGNYIVFCVCDYGTNSVNRSESELYIMDLRNDSIRKIDEINSTDSDAFHNWSANSRWMLFASKRMDGLYACLYFTMLGDDGRFSKPLLLPQKDPKKSYDESLYSYNAPDFTSKNVDIDYRKIYNDLMSDKRLTIKLKK